MFRNSVTLVRELLGAGHHVVVACNDPLDVPTAEKLFGDWLPGGVICPATPNEYLPLISEARAVVSGRLHTAVVAFSAGIPFLLFDVDQRTQGFIKTYQLERWAISPSPVTKQTLTERTLDILAGDMPSLWQGAIQKRNEMRTKAMSLLREALDTLS